LQNEKGRHASCGFELENNDVLHFNLVYGTLHTTANQNPAERNFGGSPHS
jgi:outer membrane lipopolysaccharide assembly protein LptE/RlpB